MNQTYDLMSYKVNAVSVKQYCGDPFPGPSHHRGQAPPTTGAMALSFLVTASLLVLLRVLSPDCALWTLGWSYHFLGCVCVDMAFLQVAEKEPEDIFPSKIIKNKCK